MGADVDILIAVVDSVVVVVGLLLRRLLRLMMMRGRFAGVVHPY